MIKGVLRESASIDVYTERGRRPLYSGTMTVRQADGSTPDLRCAPTSSTTPGDPRRNVWVWAMMPKPGELFTLDEEG